MARILLADDDAALRRVIEFKLRQKGYEIAVAADGVEAVKLLSQQSFDLVLSDMRMPRLTGLQLLAEVKKLHPDVEVILITAYAEISQAVEAVKLGAFDYLTKPFEDDQLFIAIEKALKVKSLELENKQLREQLNRQEKKAMIPGVSEKYREMVAIVDKVAPTDATVLLTGESGSGKEVIARSIHNKSNRSAGPFIAVNCAAIPHDLIESELFGHVKGAFTGAIKNKKGKFELAENGTLFLDEISELSTELQAKLLRVIQERVIEPVGSENRIEIDIRLMAATNVDLAAHVSKGSFREDLFYRLNVIPLNVPSLRDRRADIPILAREFVKRFAGNNNIGIDSELLKKLEQHRWPGNIRQLENLIERMVILRKGKELTVDDLPSDFDALRTSDQSESSPSTSLRGAEKKMILEALKHCDGNKSRTAKYLQIPRHVLIYRMKKYAIDN